MPRWLNKWKNKKQINALADDIRNAARHPVFYTDYRVPDTRQGRLDLLLFQLCIVSAGLAHHAGGHRLAQPVFDIILAEIQESLRQIGVGDLSIPHKMKAIMRAANGLSDQFYRLKDDPEGLQALIARNLYHNEVGDAAILAAMAGYVRAHMDRLAGQGAESFSFTVLQGQAA